MVKRNSTNLLTFFPVGLMAFMCASCAMFPGSTDGNILWRSKTVAPLRSGNIDQRTESESFYRTGIALQRESKHQKAVEMFTRAIQRAPEYAIAYNAMGVSEDALGNYTGAEQAYMAALEIDPRQHYVLNNLGYSYLLQGRYEMAVESFSKALDLDGDNRRYRNNLGLAYFKIGDTTAAFEVFKKYADEGEAHDSMAQLFYRMSYYEKAANHFAQAAALKPTCSVIDKGLSASVNMAEIFAKSLKHTTLHISPIAIHDNQGERPSSEEGEFSTIPPGRIKQMKLSAINLTELPNAKIDSSHKEISAVPQKDPGPPEKNRYLEETEMVLHAKLKPESPNSRVRIEIANGNGVRHMASQVGDFLKKKGYPLMYISNADNFKHTETSITYVKGYIAEACRISKELPGQHTIQEVEEIREGNAHISILLGNDLRIYSALFKG